MVKINSVFLFAICSGDLIGYNRLGNNIYARNIHDGHQKMPNLIELVSQQYGDSKLLRRAIASANQNTFRPKFNRRSMYVNRMMRLFN